jgi:hypothetical protein
MEADAVVECAMDIAAGMRYLHFEVGCLAVLFSTALQALLSAFQV